MNDRREARTAAQAKVNLFLHVLERATSGYHSLETLFARLELADSVIVRTGVVGRSLDCDGPASPPEGFGPPERNLAWRAAELYAEQTGWPGGFEIEVVKNIPAGAGLGGGSSDAGAVLRSLDLMSPRPLGRRLLELAARLGSDVPFLTSDAVLALAWGRGERMIALRPLPSRPVYLVPGPFVSTAEAYGWLDGARRETPGGARVHRLEELGSWSAVADVARNDFEDPVFARYPAIREVRDGLQTQGAAVALLSGSGGAVFGIFDEGGDRLPLLPAGAVVTRVSETIPPVRL
jgi:4-diphosphocytidyl-2-C-methyl-D-erythritol kinase